MERGNWRAWTNTKLVRISSLIGIYCSVLILFFGTDRLADCHGADAGSHHHSYRRQGSRQIQNSGVCMQCISNSTQVKIALVISLNLLPNWFCQVPSHCQVQDIILFVLPAGESELQTEQLNEWWNSSSSEKTTVCCSRPVVLNLFPFHQVACALLLNGARLSDYVELKNVLIEMGVYFQIQVRLYFLNGCIVLNFMINSDINALLRMTTWIALVTQKWLARYLHKNLSLHFVSAGKMLCFTELNVVQVGTDIEDYKCSWLIVQAMELANENEMKILYVRKTTIFFFYAMISSEKATTDFFQVLTAHIFACKFVDFSGELREVWPKMRSRSEERLQGAWSSGTTTLSNQTS